MIQNRFSRRRLLSKTLAGVFLAVTSPLSFGRAKNDDVQDDAVPEKAESDKVVAEKKGKNAALTIVVTGNGKPLAQAEVKVKLPAGVGGEATLSTNQSGEAIFNSAGTGTAKVRVIASGWESVLQDVILKGGPQRLTIKLTPLSNGL